MTLIVMYDRGAVSPGEIMAGLADLGPIIFVTAESEHVRRLRSVLTALAQVIPLTGDFSTDLVRIRAFSPDGILTFSESMLPITAALAAALGLPFHTAETTMLLTDKIRQRTQLRSCGVDDVRSRPVSSISEWRLAREYIGLPAVIKPVYGEGSRNTYVVREDNSAERLLVSLLSVMSVVVVEELLQGRPGLPFGDYVSVESLCTARDIMHLAITGKFPLVPPFRETGRFWPAVISAAERTKIGALVTKALRALHVTTGLTHTEVKLTPAGPRIIEVNGRLGGHVHGLAKQATGTSLVRVAGLLALGREPQLPTLDRLDRVHFQYNTLAPTRACTLLAVYGAADVRRATGVKGFRVYAKPGDIFDASVMTRHMDLLWGICEVHDDMRNILDDALGRLSYEFLFFNRTQRTSTRTQLWSQASLD